MSNPDPSPFEIKLEGRLSQRESSVAVGPGQESRPVHEKTHTFDGPCRHFAIVLPSSWDFPAPLRVNNVDLSPFKEGFSVRWPWHGAGAQGSDDPWFLRIDGKTLLKGDSFLETMSGWQVGKAAQDLLDLALQRRLDRDGFVRVVDGLGLPPDWRNGLVNDLFAHAAGTPTPAPAPEDSGLDGLLSRVALPGGEKSGVDQALDHFIGSVASSGADTGFRFDAEAARRWKEKIAAWVKSTQATFLDHPRVAVEFGFLAAIGGLVRSAKGRKRHWLHVLPGNLSLEAWKAWVLGCQAEEPGPWDVIAFPEAETSDPWKHHVDWVGAQAFLQLPEGEETIPPVWRQEWGSVAFAFLGYATAEASGHCLRKPGSWVALQAILQEGLGFSPATELRYEEESPCTRHSDGHGADALRSVEEITALRRAGINPVIGARRTLEISIAPLVRMAGGAPPSKADHA